MKLRGDFVRRIIFLLFNFILIMSLLSTTAYAHSGKTDSNGGHYDRDSGEYHYHHGYPAHSHTNGECPYDFDDKTDQTPNNSNSHNSNDSKNTLDSSNDSNSKDTPAKPQKTQAKTPIWKNIVGIIFGALIYSPLILSVLFFTYYRIILPVIEWVKKIFK